MRAPCEYRSHSPSPRSVDGELCGGDFTPAGDAGQVQGRAGELLRRAVGCPVRLPSSAESCVVRIQQVAGLPRDVAAGTLHCHTMTHHCDSSLWFITTALCTVAPSHRRTGQAGQGHRGWRERCAHRSLRPLCAGLVLGANVLQTRPRLGLLLAVRRAGVALCEAPGSSRSVA